MQANAFSVYGAAMLFSCGKIDEEERERNERNLPFLFPYHLIYYAWGKQHGRQCTETLYPKENTVLCLFCFVTFLLLFCFPLGLERSALMCVCVCILSCCGGSRLKYPKTGITVEIKTYCALKYQKTNNY